MNGVHDMGGMHGFGAVRIEANEPAFHEPWEGRVLGISRSMANAGAWNAHSHRDSTERVDPVTYLSASYYEKNFVSMVNHLLEMGLITEDELEAGHSLRPASPLPRHLAAADISPALRRGRTSRTPTGEPRFAAGDRVRTLKVNPHRHTRLPRYARGRVGVVAAIEGFKPLADSSALGPTEDPQWHYTVVFEGSELWGEGSEPRLSVTIGAAESQIEPA
jgi:nitrile hydratase subunit beta